MIDNSTYTVKAVKKYIDQCNMSGKGDLKLLLEIKTLSDSLDFCKKQSLTYKSYNEYIRTLSKLLLKKINKL